jgi:hypothetical protein
MSKEDNEDLSLSADEHQVGGVWVGYAVGVIGAVVAWVLTVSRDKSSIVIALGLTAFAAIPLIYKVWQLRRRRLEWNKLISSLKWPLGGFTLVALLLILWAAGLFVWLQNWLLVSVNISRGFVAAVIGIFLWTILWLVTSRRELSAIKKQQVQSKEVAAQDELKRIDLTAQEYEGGLHNEIKNLQSRLDQHREWLARMTREILELQGVHTEQLEEIEKIDRALSTLTFWKLNAVRKVVYFDPNYKTQFVSNTEQAKSYFVRRGFIEKDATALQNWMLESIKNNDAHKCLVVFVHDVAPKSIVEVINPTCILRRFLDSGGRVVWRGDVPFYYLGMPTGAIERLDTKGAWEVLGVSYMNLYVTSEYAKDNRLWDGEFPVEITQAGRDIGLVRVGLPRRPVPEKHVDAVFSRLAVKLQIQDQDYVPPKVDGNFACCWKKNYSPHYPHSGFMQYHLGEWDGSNEEELESFFSFAISNWPLDYFSVPSYPFFL